MNDPHVVSLTYELEQGDEVRYAEPPPMRFRSGGFEGVLQDGVLILKPEDHYPSLETARVLADRFLRGWELDARLNEGRPALSFQYVTGKMIDRNPPPPGSPGPGSPHR